MTELATLLETTGIRRAVVIDDVFDEVPRTDELSDDSWTVFFDDLNERGRQLLLDLYSGYDKASLDELRQSQEFVSLVWEHREELPAAALFGEYENTHTREKQQLDDLVTRLQKFGLACKAMGRNLDEAIKDADLIVVDLFLGFQQSEGDMNRAVRRVEELIRGRTETPPLVILMSRSPRLLELKNDFRDSSGLLSSTFRVVSKSDLVVPGVLDTLLRRLANHYEDAKRVAKFVHAWDTGLARARQDFIEVLRRLDLSDFAQIRSLLLEFEGQKLGEYILDVVDGVLRHEIEGGDATISAALELNNVNLTKYPAPHLVGTPDLQALVHRMVFIHPSRLRLSKDTHGLRLQFGDLLRWRNEDRTEFTNEVSLVITPACDLVRRGAKRVALLSGRLESLGPENWSYRDRPVKTAIVILAGEERKWIRWDLKDVKTLNWNEIETSIEQGGLARVGRFRELYAIAIQQMALADFGRIGPPADLPAVFSVEVTLFYVNADRKAQKLDVDGIELGICYVGRDEHSESAHRLVLTEQTCDRIESTLRGFDASRVHRAARSSLEALMADNTFFDRLEQGKIEVPQTGQGPKQVRSNDNNICAVVVRDDSFSDGSEVSGWARKAALIIRVSDV